MTLSASTPSAGELAGVLAVQASWQRGDAPLQIHPGDLGWFGRFGPDQTAAATRTWSRDGALAVVGLLDGPTLLRLAVDPELLGDRDLAEQVAADLPVVLPAQGPGFLEVCAPAVLREVLSTAGWALHEPWTQLRRDLAAPVPAPALQVVAVSPDEVVERVAVQRGAFDGSTFTAERWAAMAAGPAYAHARCLLGLDEDGSAVAAATVWSAGPGRVGLLEPVGVHRDHQGHGHGRAISLAAAAALQSMGASHAQVCTPSSNSAAVATYASAGFEVLGETRDLERPSPSPDPVGRPAEGATAQAGDAAGEP